MSLDKWLKPGKKAPKKKPTIKIPAKKEPVKKVPERKSEEKKSVKLFKFSLSCPKKGCNYQKIKVKKELSERDKICPKCKGQMNVKQI